MEALPPGPVPPVAEALPPDLQALADGGFAPNPQLQNKQIIQSTNCSV